MSLWQYKRSSSLVPRLSVKKQGQPAIDISRVHTGKYMTHISSHDYLPVFKFIATQAHTNICDMEKLFMECVLVKKQPLRYRLA